MKTKIITALIILLAVLIISCTAGCVDNKPTYIFGIDPAMPPGEYFDENGNAAGITVDFLNEVAKIENFNIKYVPSDINWIDDLNSGKVDAVTSLIITPEREKLVSFTGSPFEPARYTIFALDNSGITVDDFLAGKVSIASSKGGAYEAWLKNHFGDKYESMINEGKIVLTINQDDPAMEVLSGKTETAFAGDTLTSNMLNNYPTLDFIGFVGEPSITGIAVKKGNQELVDLINAGNEIVKATPEFQKMCDKFNLQYKKPVYTVGIDDSNDPWSYIGSDGKYTGYDIEQIEWIADYSGFDVDYKVYNWDNNINAITVGNVDMWASSMTITPERMMSVAFSDPYYSSGIGIGIKPEASFTKADFDSAGSKIVTLYGTTYAEWLEGYFGTAVYNKRVADGSIILAEDSEEFYSLFNSGKADFAAQGTRQIEDDVNKNIMKLLFSEEGIEDFGIATSNGNIVLQDMINKGLAEFEKSGKKAELLKKYNI